MSTLDQQMMQLGCSYFWTGSYAISGNMHSDFDAVIIYTGEIDAKLKSLGFASSDMQADLIYPNSSVVVCYRREQLNIIAVRSELDFERWRQATWLAQDMHLEHKDQRVKLFQFLTEGALRDGSAVNPDWPVVLDGKAGAL